MLVKGIREPHEEKKKIILTSVAIELTTSGPGEGGGGVLDRSLGALHTLTVFKTNITDFPTLFKTELQFLIPCLRHLKLRVQEVVWLSCWVINGNLMCLVSMPKSTEVNIN